MECLMDSLGVLTGATIGLLVIVLRDFVKFKAHMLAEITRLSGQRFDDYASSAYRLWPGPQSVRSAALDLREWDRDAALTRVKSANAESHQPTTGNSEERQTT